MNRTVSPSVGWFFSGGIGWTGLGTRFSRWGSNQGWDEGEEKDWREEGEERSEAQVGAPARVRRPSVARLLAK